jgi:hypothetical protein
MKWHQRQPLKVRINASRWGRVLLHIGTCLRRPRNARWHLRCIVRELRELGGKRN